MRVWLSRVAAILTCAAVVFPAWAYGGAESWAVRMFAVLVMFAVVVSVISCLSEHRELWLLSWVWLVGVFVLLVFYIAVQALNPSHVYNAVYNSLEPIWHFTWLPSSVSAPCTIRALLLLIVCGGLFWLSSLLLSARYIYAILLVIIFSAVSMAVLSLLQGGEHKLWDPVGMFLNANSFSAYMNLIFPVTLACARELQRMARRNGAPSNPGVLLYFCAGIMVVSVLLSGSRAGGIIAVALLLGWTAVEWAESQRKGMTRRRKIVRVILPLVIVAGLMALFGADIIFREAERSEKYLAGDIRTRFIAAWGALRMFADHPVFGTGAGTFNVAFVYYQPDSLTGFYRHAHNDWAQWLAELGSVGAVLGGLCLTLVFRLKPANMRRDISSLIVRGMALGLAGTAVHALLDFPFRIPGIIAIAAVWFGFIARRGWGAARPMVLEKGTSH